MDEVTSDKSTSGIDAKAKAELGLEKEYELIKPFVSVTCEIVATNEALFNSKCKIGDLFGSKTVAETTFEAASRILTSYGMGGR